MKTPLGTEVDLGPSHTVLDGDPPPSAKGAQQPPLFSAHVEPISATAELFSIHIMHNSNDVVKSSLKRSVYSGSDDEMSVH